MDMATSAVAVAVIIMAGAGVATVVTGDNTARFRNRRIGTFVPARSCRDAISETGELK
jgi:hypothetical protein